jgi:hypothetical protein
VSYDVPYRLICRGCRDTSTGVCSTDRILPKPNGWTCPNCHRPLRVTLADVDGGGVLKIRPRGPHLVALNGWVMQTGPTQRDRKRQQTKLNSRRARITIRGRPIG